MSLIIQETECGRCKQALRLVTMADGREYAWDLKTNETHVCWDLPEDANLLVMDD